MWTYISGFLGLAMSFPFNPALINTGPSQRIILNVIAKAMIERLPAAINGAPSPWKVLTRIPTPTPTSTNRRQVSVRERVFEEDISSNCTTLRSGLQTRLRQKQLASEKGRNADTNERKERQLTQAGFFIGDAPPKNLPAIRSYRCFCRCSPPIMAP